MLGLWARRSGKRDALPWLLYRSLTICQSWINETYGDRPDLRAFLIGTCQTLGATFSAWVPVVVFNTGKYSPLFHMGYTVVTVLAAAQVSFGPCISIFIFSNVVGLDSACSGYQILNDQGWEDQSI
jgi:hypothetical protein